MPSFYLEGSICKKKYALGADQMIVIIMPGLDMKSKCDKKVLLRSVWLYYNFLYHITTSYIILHVLIVFTHLVLIFCGYVSSHTILTYKLTWTEHRGW